MPCTRSVNDGDAAAELVVQRLAARIEEREEEPEEPEPGPDRREQRPGEGEQRARRITPQRAQALAGERHAGRPAAERDEAPGPGERDARAERGPEERDPEHEVQPIPGLAADAPGQPDMPGEERGEESEIDRPTRGPAQRRGARGDRS